MDRSHFDWYEMVPHCGFDSHFSDNEWCWASFHVFVSHLYVFFFIIFVSLSLKFFGKPFLFFNWRIIALQCCAGFWHTTHEWVIILYIYVYIYPPSGASIPPPILPLQGITKHQAELPVSYSSFPLVIYFKYDRVYLSMILSQFILPSPSPAVSTCHFSTYVFPFLLCKWVHQYRFSKFHIYMH